MDVPKNLHRSPNPNQSSLFLKDFLQLGQHLIEVVRGEWVGKLWHMLTIQGIFEIFADYLNCGIFGKRVDILCVKLPMLSRQLINIDLL